MHSFRTFRITALLFSFSLLLIRSEAADAPSDAELAQFGEQLAAQMAGGDPKMVLNTFDPFAFMRVALKGLDVDDDDARQMAVGFRQGFSRNFEKEYGQLSSARFLRVQRLAGESRVLMRFVPEAGGVVYTSFVCERGANNSVKWIDLYSYVSGEKLSDTSRRVFIPLVAEKKKSLLDRLTGSETSFVKHLAKLQEATGLLRDGKPAEALAIYNALPADLQKERFVLLVRLQAAQQLNDSAHLQVLEDWEAAYPNDPALNFIAIDADLLRKNMAGAIRRVDAFSRSLGGDAYLTLLKANIQTMAEDFDAAKASAREALRQEPSLLDAYDLLLTIALNQKNYDELAAVLVQIEAANPQLDMKSAIAEMEAYAEFRKSDAYKKWDAERAKKRAGLGDKEPAETAPASPAKND